MTLEWVFKWVNEGGQSIFLDPLKIFQTLSVLSFAIIARRKWTIVILFTMRKLEGDYISKLLIFVGNFSLYSYTSAFLLWSIISHRDLGVLWLIAYSVGYGDD